MRQLTILLTAAAALLVLPVRAQNGINVRDAKVYDNRSLTIMLEQLNQQLVNITVVDPQKLAAALGSAKRIVLTGCRDDVPNHEGAERERNGACGHRRYRCRRHRFFGIGDAGPCTERSHCAGPASGSPPIVRRTPKTCRTY